MPNETVIEPYAQPNDDKSTHELVLSALNRKVGLRLLRGLPDITPSTSRAQTTEAGGEKSQFGSFGNTHTELPQRSWLGGQNWDRWEENREGYLYSRNAWTMAPGKYMHGPQVNYGLGYRNENRYLPLPHSVSWRQLHGSQRYASLIFTADPLAGAGSYDAAKGYLYLRKRGDPKQGVTLSLYSDSSTEPDAALKQVTLTTADITDKLALWQAFGFASAETLADGTAYHVVVNGGADATAKNCWEVGVDADNTGSLISADGSTWVSAGFKLYYRITDADVQRKWLWFEWRGAWYALSQRLDRTASKLYIVGDRGVVTAGSASSTLEDSNSGMYAGTGWTTDQWAGAYVEIITTSAKGQVRKIASNDSNTLTITGTWDVVPGAGAEYVIHGSYHFRDISPASGAQIDVFVSSVVAGSDQVYFARGINTSYPILRMSFTAGGSPPVHAWADDADTTNSLADLLYIYTDPYAGTRLAKVNNDGVTVAFSELTAIGTQLSWSTAQEVGSTARLINSLVVHENQLWAVKSDGLYYLTSTSDQNWYEFSTQLRSLINPNNGIDSISAQKQLWLTYGGFTVERILGDSIEDVGPWINAGLRSNEKGAVVALAPVFDYMAYGIDAGSAGYSSVLVRRGDSFHKIFHSYEVGQSVRNVRLHSSSSGSPWLWISVGADAAFQILPGASFNPENDTNFYFAHEAVIETGYYDMDAVRLYKMLRAMYVAYKNMANGLEVEIEYQIDNKVGMTGDANWTSLGICRQEEGQELLLERGNIRRVAFRYISRTNSATDSLHILATILTAYTRLPSKPMYAVQATLGGTSRAHKDDYSAQYIYDALEAMAESAVDVKAESIFPFLHGRKFTLDYPVPVPRTVKHDGGRGENDEIEWAGVVNLVMIKA